MNIAHPEWVDDPDFDLKNHVFAHRLPEGTTLEHGVDAAITLNEPILDRAKPLWRVYVISGVPDRTLILQMTHHAMIDGASGIELTTVLVRLRCERCEQRTSAEGTVGAAAVADRCGTVHACIARQHDAARQQPSCGGVPQRRGTGSAVAQSVRRVFQIHVAAGGNRAVQRGYGRPHAQVALDETAARRNSRNPSRPRRNDQRRSAHGRFRSGGALSEGTRRAGGRRAPAHHVSGKRAH